MLNLFTGTYVNAHLMCMHTIHWKQILSDLSNCIFMLKELRKCSQPLGEGLQMPLYILVSTMWCLNQGANVPRMYCHSLEIRAVTWTTYVSITQYCQPITSAPSCGLLLTLLSTVCETHFLLCYIKMCLFHDDYRLMVIAC